MKKEKRKDSCLCVWKDRKNCRKKYGFTLVEVIVTLLLIVTLSLLSYPLYRKHTFNSSKLAEGYALIGTIVEAQVSYYNEYGNFLSAKDSFWGSTEMLARACTAVDPVLGINVINNRYFTKFGYDYGTVGFQYWQYCFKARAFSESAGTVMLIYDLTQRFEPEVTGV